MKRLMYTVAIICLTVTCLMQSIRIDALEHNFKKLNDSYERLEHLYEYRYNVINL